MRRILIAEEKHFSAMCKIYAPYVEKTTVSFEYTPPAEEEFAARMRALSSEYPVLVMADGEEVLGYAYAAKVFERKAYAWNTELSVYVREDRRGEGMGKELVLAIEKICVLLGFRKIFSLITEENGASIAFHHAIGYEDVAFFPEQGYKFGKWLGVLWLSKDLNGRECGEKEPIVFSSLSEKQLIACGVSGEDVVHGLDISEKEGSFSEKVYAFVSRVPRGKVVTYGQVAAAAGNPKASRAVGYVLHHNPMPGVIPCHRVVNRMGKTASGFAFGGAEVQRNMLEEEGVLFDEEGVTDLEIFGWRG